jgi:hypothetical protein
MNCLTNYVGLRYTGSPTPLSGIYVNELQGISTELLNSVADCEQVDYLGMWEDVQNRAYRELCSDLISELGTESYFEGELWQTKRPVTLNSEVDIIPAASEYRGTIINLPESKYLGLYIKGLFVYSTTIVSTTFKVFDKRDGVELYSKDVDLVVGVNMIQIEAYFGQRFGSIEVFAGIDCTAVNTCKTDEAKYYFTEKEDHVCECESPSIVPGSVSLLDSKVDSNIEEKTGMGVWVDCSVICSIDSFVCENKKILSVAWSYLLGVEILKEKLASYNLNYFAASNLEQTNVTKNELNNSYKKFLKQAAKRINRSGDVYCFTCNKSEGWKSVYS